MSLNGKICFVILLFFILQEYRISAQPTCVQCCCGNAIEVGIPGGDFEDPPYSNPIIVYFAGEMYSSWSIISGSIDVLGPNYSNWASGNPNGASQFIDLHGNTPGAFATTLSGLNVGYEYSIVLWYAKNAGAASANCQIQVAGGAWLDQTWTATNNGASGWLQKCYSFTAQASSAELKFTGSGATTAGGVLLDDITMFCCPPKSIPVFSDPPQDISGIQCVKDIPPVPVPTIEDDCDNNPVVVFTTKTNGQSCNQTITRTWEVTNSCGNTATAEQIIYVEDTEAPIFTQDPQDLIIDCSDDITGQFVSWLEIHGGALASDNCEGVLSWTKDYDKEPEFPCSETIVTFIVEDNCGNVESRTASFIVEDIEDPKIVIPPVDVVLVCVTNPYDSLIIWVSKHAFSSVTDNCGMITWSNDFNGDKTKTDYVINFMAIDECNNSISFTASFKIKPGGITNLVQKKSCDLSQVGIDTLVYQVNGCDSIVIIQTSFSPADTILFSGITCKQSEAGLDTLVFQNQNGCDSLIIRNISYIKPDTTLLENKSCALLNFSIDTIIYQGLYCDSVVLVKNIPLLSDNIQVNLNTCDSTQAGIFVVSLLNQNGCDSVVTKVITYSGFTFSNQTVNLCGSQQNYSDTISYITPECDSFVFIQYIFHQSDTSKINIGTCDQQLTGTDTLVLNNNWGCDSLVITTKYLLPTDSTFISQYTCNVMDAGIFYTTLSNKFGCDSIVVSQINYIKSDSVFIETITCDPTLAGVTVSNYPTALCDSVVITNTTLVFPSESKKSLNSCLVTSVQTDTVILVNALGCDSLVITEMKPQSLQAYLSSGNVSCKGMEDGKIEIDSIKNGAGPYFYSFNKIDYFPLNQIQGLVPDNYTLYLKDNAGCETIIENIVIEEGEEFTIDLGADKTITEGTEILLVPIYSSIPYNIKWSPSDLFSCPVCPEHIINIGKDQKIFLYAENLNGCPATDSIFFKVKPDIKVFIPNVFSPDLNGINDYFTIYSDYHLLNIKELNIYSRWGEQVFHTENIPPNNPTFGWNGKVKGKLMDPAVFVFWALLEFDDGSTELYKGEVTIVR